MFKIHPLKNLDLDNKFKISIENCFEYLLWKLFSIDILNLIKTEAFLCKNFRIMPGDIEHLPYWQYELFIDELRILIENENKKYKVEEQKYNKQTNKYKNISSNSMKLPTYDSMKLPTYNNH